MRPHLAILLTLAILLSACSELPDQNEELILYSGRSESLVGPVLEQFEAASGIKVSVRWGSTGELAATLLEEGDRSPADLFFAQDPGGLGAVADLLSTLPAETLERVSADWRDPMGRWIGISGRARVIVYNTDHLTQQNLPGDLWEFTDPAWKGRLGWAPTNASFQTMITAMRAAWGEADTRLWLEKMSANKPVVYDNNTAIVAAVGAGEVEAGFVNHYYLYRFLQEEGENFPARNFFLSDGGPGALVMPSGIGILKTAKNPAAAEKFLEFLLSPVAQQYFATQTYEYPVVEGVVMPRELPVIGTLHPISIDIASLADIQGTITLLRETGILP